VRQVLWSILYVIAMAVLLRIHLTVACGKGDCI
jgi:hypothetical protein